MMKLITVSLVLELAMVGAALPARAPAPDPLSGRAPLTFQGLESGNWSTAKCTQPAITDAAAPPHLRWSEVDAGDAWAAVVRAWNTEAMPAGDVQLPFTEYVSNFFNGPEQWNCQDIGSIPCSDVVQCHDTNHPAGYLILNSFSALHQIHQHISQALGEAMVEMQSNIGAFTTTFAPQLKNDLNILKTLLDVLALAIGIGSASAWNIVIKNAKLFEDDNYRGFAKDVFNGAISTSMAIAKDNFQADSSSLGLQNTLSAALGSIFHAWQQTEADYINLTFSGHVETLSTLSGLLQDGMMTTIPNDLDLTSLNSQAQAILYALMIPTAWSLAPGNLSPFILMTNDACPPSKKDGHHTDLISGDDAVRTFVCYSNKTFYVLDRKWLASDGICGIREPVVCGNGGPGESGRWQFSPLPGGTMDNMNGGKYGGVKLDDIVISSYDGFVLNGNRNGYQMPNTSKMLDGLGTEGDLILQRGIRTPGFFSVPIYT